LEELMDFGEKKLRDDAIGENDEINYYWWEGVVEFESNPSAVFLL
jgi:hypothetical protein